MSWRPGFEHIATHKKGRGRDPFPQMFSRTCVLRRSYLTLK